MALNWKSTYALMHAKGKADFPSACLYYVLEITRQGYQHRSNQPSTSSELIQDFRKKTKADFGPLLSMVLEEWNMKMPSDLGKAVMLLGSFGCLHLTSQDTLESFGTDVGPF